MILNITNEEKAKIQEFGEKIDSWQLWGYFEIRAFLFKPKEKGKWIAAFLDVRLHNQKIKERRKLPATSTCRIVHKVYKMAQSSNFLHQLIHKDSVTLGNIQVSLELVLGVFTHELNLRSYCQQEYGIDEACLILISGGKFTDELGEALKKFDSELQSFTDYTSSKSAIRQELGIDFGTYAYYPFVRILAPIYLKILKAEFNDNKFTFSLTAEDKVDPKHVKVSLEGYDQSGRTTGFSKIISTFERLKHQNSFRPITIDVLPYSQYVKLVLSYRGEATEDFFLKNVEYTYEEISSQEPEYETETDLRSQKSSIRTLYEDALRSTNNNEKGKLLERFISDLIKLVPELKVVGVRVDDGVQEVDLVIRNLNKKGVWSDLEGVIFVECKNWSDPAGAAEIRNFHGKLMSKCIKCGLFVSIHGITGEGLQGATEQLQRCLQAGYKIIILEGKDIEDMLNCKDVSAKIDEKYIKLYT
jgi:hypothetical protein